MIHKGATPAADCRRSETDHPPHHPHHSNHSGLRRPPSLYSDYRDVKTNMPDSPDVKVLPHSVVAPPPSGSPTNSASSHSIMAPVTPAARSLNANPSPSMNGALSPHSSLSGRTPSPPSMMGGMGGGSHGASSQQLPPACGARQLSKLKRFLTTLQQFGSDISPEIGERVRSLVLGLVNNHLSIEEFHGKLQEATNFPLRPFVIPFLKANLPLLQRELLHCARLAKQTPQQYVAHNEHILFDPANSPIDTSHDVVSSSDVNENGKRRSPDSRSKENGLDSHPDLLHPAKRHHAVSPGSSTSSRVSPSSGNPYQTNPLQSGGPIRLEDISMSRELRERERIERERLERERMDRVERERHFSGSYSNYQRSDQYEPLDRIDDDWKHVETMLHCIVGMVDKTKRALSVLQERSQRDREELTVWMRRQAEGMDNDMKKRTSEMMATTLRQTEDRVTEVKRRAEEAVNEVKRQAVAELQKAVAAAEAKANELISHERTKMERELTTARRSAQEEYLGTVTHQEEAGETCWNCGRKASETCSGCNVARYCGSFCQHKDWENHHHVCSQPHAVRDIQTARDAGNSSAVTARYVALATAAATAATGSSHAAVATGSPSLTSAVQRHSTSATATSTLTTTSSSATSSSTPAEMTPLSATSTTTSSTTSSSSSSAVKTSSSSTSSSSPTVSANNTPQQQQTQQTSSSTSPPPSGTLVSPEVNSPTGSPHSNASMRGADRDSHHSGSGRSSPTDGSSSSGHSKTPDTPH